MVQRIRERELQSDGTYLIKHKETHADIVLYDTGETNADGSPKQTKVQDEIDTIKTKIEKGGTIGIATSKDIPITLLASDWTGDTAPYLQTVEAADIMSGMTPVHFLSSSDSGNDNAEYAYSLITNCVSNAGSITFYASDLPEVDLHIVLKGIPAQIVEYVDNDILIPVNSTLFVLNEETQRYEQTIAIEAMTPGYGGTFDILRSGVVLTAEESAIIANITDIERNDGSIKIICRNQPTANYTLILYGTYTDASEGTTLLANMNGWFNRVENLETSVSELNSKLLPDFSKVIKSSFDAGETWTATEDCWIIGCLMYSTSQGKVDTGITQNNKYLASCYNSNGNSYSPVCIPIKMGTTIRTNAAGEYNMTAYGF